MPSLMKLCMKFVLPLQDFTPRFFLAALLLPFAFGVFVQNCKGP